MILMRFLPDILKEMLKNVPSLLFDVVDWKELTHVLPIMSKRILSRDQVLPLLKDIESEFSTYQLQFSEELQGQKTTELTESEKKEIATNLLKIYFQQLYNPQGQLLDLRSDFFSYKDQILLWKPNGIWASWKQEFQTGLIDVYKGFYLQEEDLFRSGLKAIGLIQEQWSQDDQDQMASLFKNHFGSSLSAEMNFNIDDFKNSFINIFHFLLEKKVRMSADFMYLGLMLVTLYLHLEELNQPLNVRTIFIDVMKKNQAI